MSNQLTTSALQQHQVELSSMSSKAGGKRRRPQMFKIVEQPTGSMRWVLHWRISLLGFKGVITLKHVFFACLFCTVAAVFWLLSPITSSKTVACNSQSLNGKDGRVCLTNVEMSGQDFDVVGYQVADATNFNFATVTAEELTVNASLYQNSYVVFVMQYSGMQFRMCDRCIFEIWPGGANSSTTTSNNKFHVTGGYGYDVILNRQEDIISGVSGFQLTWSIFLGIVKSAEHFDFIKDPPGLNQKFPCNSSTYTSLDFGSNVPTEYFCYNVELDWQMYILTTPTDVWSASCSIFKMSCSKQAINVISSLVVTISFMSTTITFARLRSIHRFFKFITGDTAPSHGDNDNFSQVSEIDHHARIRDIEEAEAAAGAASPRRHNHHRRSTASVPVAAVTSAASLNDGGSGSGNGSNHGAGVGGPDFILARTGDQFVDKSSHPPPYAPPEKPRLYDADRPSDNNSNTSNNNNHGNNNNNNNDNNPGNGEVGAPSSPVTDPRRNTRDDHSSLTSED